MKSAYEKALEKLEKAGISRPELGSVTDEQRERITEARQKAEAQLAELEILHQKNLETLVDPAEREKAEEEYRIDRSRVESRCDDEVERIRRGE